MSLDRNALRERAKRKPTVKEIDIPDWGTICVRKLKSGERDAYIDSLSKLAPDGKSTIPLLQNRSARFAVLAICDADGQPLFGAGDVAEVAEWDGEVLDRIVTEARKLNGLLVSSVEEAEKNSSAGPSAGSSSDSPDTSASPSDGSSGTSTPTS